MRTLLQGPDPALLAFTGATMVATTPLGTHSHHAAKIPESVGLELVRLYSIERLDRELSK